jgi:hypothetical protein
MVTDFEKSTGELASSPASPEPQNLKFERADWTSFRTVEGLQQKAGVAKDKLRRLTLDDGGGIDGTPEEIARLFSIARPMVSTKLLRLPTRGALGNGLRVGVPPPRSFRRFTSTRARERSGKSLQSGAGSKERYDLPVIIGNDVRSRRGRQHCERWLASSELPESHPNGRCGAPSCAGTQTRISRALWHSRNGESG